LNAKNLPNLAAIGITDVSRPFVFRPLLAGSIFLISVFLLASCGSKPVKDLDTALIDTTTYTAAETTELSEQAQQYLESANQSSGNERELLLLKSAQFSYLAGDFSKAKNTLSKMRPNPLNYDAKLLSAKIALAQNRPQAALSMVPNLKLLNNRQSIQAQLILADGDIALGYAMSAVERRVRLEPQLRSTESRRKNNEQIWSALSSMPSTTLYSQTTNDSRIAAWLDLARIMRGFTSRGGSTSSSVETAVLDWATHHPENTVSNEFLSQLIDEYIRTAKNVTTIAVLLPQQGKFSVAAETIKNGLLSAYYADTQTNGQHPTLRFYDTSDTSVPISTLITQAVDDGASNIIGPLDKTLIDKLTNEQNLTVPVLTLNYGKDTNSTTNNLFQFGLAPEDEARQVAELAIRQGRKSAVVLSPDSDWGRRLQSAFIQYFEELGGIVVNAQDYSTTSADYSRSIRRLLNLDKSSIRHRRIENTLSQKLEFTPYRRDDIDMIFIAATSGAARGIIPAFKFHHASNLPVYSTSHAYTGVTDIKKDIDLNGLLFCDMPWVLETGVLETGVLKTGALKTAALKTGKSKQSTTQPKNNNAISLIEPINSNIDSIASLKKTFQTNWPDQQRYTRLFALGVDAYHLVFNLEYLHANQYGRFSGTTGNIQLDKHNRIVRDLLWAKFIKGKAVLIEPEIKFELPRNVSGNQVNVNSDTSPAPSTSTTLPTQATLSTSSH